MPTAVVLSSGYFAVNAKDLSAYVLEVTPNYGAESLDKSTWGTGTRIMTGGLKTWSFDMKFLYEQSTTGPEAILFNLIGTTSCIEYRHINVCSSANNPIYSGIGTLESFNTGGAVGSLLSASGRFVASGALSRASSS